MVCFQAKEWWERKGGPEGDLSMAQLKVAGTTHRTRKARWGQYREMKKKSLEVGKTDIEAKEIQVIYEEKFGLT